MSQNGMPASNTPSRNVDTQIDVRRYLSALRRSRLLMALIVLAITGAVLFLSLTLPKTYEATAQIVLDPSSDPLAPADAESTQRQLATIDALINGSEVQDQAADQVPGETSDSIGNALDSAVDPEANLVNISASDGDPNVAADIANAVATTFLDVQRKLEQERLAGAEEELRSEIERVEARPDAEAQATALRERLNSIQVQRSTAGSDLQLAETAEPPSSPASPKPFRNLVLALFASIFIAVLVALARDQLSPRMSSPREMSRVMGAPVLAVIPHVSRRKRTGGRSRRLSGAVEHEAYQTLRSALQLDNPGETRVVIITSAVHAEGKTTVTARLGAALARAGKRTLLISADLRWPSLHKAFELPVQPGLTDVLALIERAGVSRHILAATARPVAFPGTNSDEPPTLRGHRQRHQGTGPRPDPGQRGVQEPPRPCQAWRLRLRADRLTSDSRDRRRPGDDRLRRRRPAGVAPDRLTIENVVDTQELLERLGVRPMGLVVVDRPHRTCRRTTSPTARPCSPPRPRPRS